MGQKENEVAEPLIAWPAKTLPPRPANIEFYCWHRGMARMQATFMDEADTN
jgi:hypothetical protein